VIELLNSKGVFGPPLRLFDHAAWRFDVCRRVGSPSIKVLYDIFHAQLMDGDIAPTIRENIAHIGHIHVAEVPERHQLDDAQELNYTYLTRVIARTGYDRFISHEWLPRPGADGEQALRHSIELIRNAALAA
jgi:hydroxypyruvate isomerase